MARQQPKSWSQTLTSLVLPLSLGLGLYLLLGLMIDREVITNELLLRYLTGHPISRFTSFMACIGIAALLLIANNVFDQFCNVRKITLKTELTTDDPQRSSEAPPAQVESIVRTAELRTEQLTAFRRSIQSHYLWQRLYSALSFIQRTGGTAGVEDELKYLADLDQDTQQRRYSLVRIVIWATPMLGFLGTVLGISQALGGIQVGPDNDFQQMLNSLRGSLFVAFDTTALALTLSIMLMFFQFFVERFELQLLDVVDRRAQDELSPMYEHDKFVDAQTRAIERVGRTVVSTAQDLMGKQTEIWRESMENAESAWVDKVADVGDAVKNGISESLVDAVDELSQTISKGIADADDSMAQRWEQWQVLLSENARQMNGQQQQMLAQAELLTELLKKIESTNDIQQLLNKNLDDWAKVSRAAVPHSEEKSAESNTTLDVNTEPRSDQGAATVRIYSAEDADIQPRPDPDQRSRPVIWREVA